MDREKVREDRERRRRRMEGERGSEMDTARVRENGESKGGMEEENGEEVDSESEKMQREKMGRER